MTKEIINQDFLQAFKDRDTVKKTLLGVIKGEIQNEELRTGKDADVPAILKKMEKSLLQTNTVDSLIELEVIKPYLPQMLSGTEVAKNITAYIHEENCDSIPKIMAAFNRDYKGRVDNKLVLELAKIQLK